MSLRSCLEHLRNGSALYLALCAPALAQCETAKLFGSAPEASGLVGQSVAVCGDTILVGALGPYAPPFSGAAYFSFTGTRIWTGTRS